MRSDSTHSAVAKMISLGFALMTLLLPPAFCARRGFRENNPALGGYQDTVECFPAKADFYLLYRNYEYDPHLGGTAKCVYAAQNDPLINNSTFMTFTYGDVSERVKMTFAPGPGYTTRNTVNFEKLDGSGTSFGMTAAYLACSKCHILRSDYINGGTGCMLWVPENALNEDRSCCHFIFDLLCGTSTKYHIYQGCK